MFGGLGAPTHTYIVLIDYQLLPNFYVGRTFFFLRHRPPKNHPFQRHRRCRRSSVRKLKSKKTEEKNRTQICSSFLVLHSFTVIATLFSAVVICDKANEHGFRCSANFAVTTNRTNQRIKKNKITEDTSSLLVYSTRIASILRAAPMLCHHRHTRTQPNSA